MPLGWPTPLDVEVEGVGAWVGMGVGVVGGCGPTVAPLTPLPGLSVEPPSPPLWCIPAGVGSGCPPLCDKFHQGSPHMGDGVCGLWPKFCQGFPPRGGVVQMCGHPRRLPALRRPNSWRINFAAPQVRGVGGCCPKFRQGFPPRGGIVQVGLHP